MRKLQAEIDDLIGDHDVQVDDLNKLPYLTGRSYGTRHTAVV